MGPIEDYFTCNEYEVNWVRNYIRAQGFDELEVVRHPDPASFYNLFIFHIGKQRIAVKIPEKMSVQWRQDVKVVLDYALNVAKAKLHNDRAFVLSKILGEIL